ncbi:MAG: hypothetical protein ABSG43_02090 [Solirubrobacteraceae bacterium]
MTSDCSEFSAIRNTETLTLSPTAELLAPLPELLPALLSAADVEALRANCADTSNIDCVAPTPLIAEMLMISGSTSRASRFR